MPLANGGADAGVLFQESQCGLLYQALRISACRVRNLSEFRFLLGGEMDFHGSQLTRNPPLRQLATVTLHRTFHSSADDNGHSSQTPPRQLWTIQV
jgi:hypothetical protein